jgi:hypothetical protein
MFAASLSFVESDLWPALPPFMGCGTACGHDAATGGDPWEVPGILRRVGERTNEGSRHARISAKIRIDSSYSTISTAGGRRRTVT